MPTYLYCLTRSGAEPPPALLGIDDAPVRVVEEDAARAWVSDVSASPPVTVERARAHDRVIREAMRGATPLPARFGQVVADDQAIRRELVRRAASLRAALDRVADAVEMTVRLHLGPREERKQLSSKELTGRAYLEGLSQAESEAQVRQERAEFLQRLLAGAVTALVREESVSSATGAGAGGAGRALVISHLVARENVAAYRRAVRAVVEQASSREWRIPVMISGPWPPYSFAELPSG